MVVAAGNVPAVPATPVVNPPPPPPDPLDPPINFTYTDCGGNPADVNVDFGAPVTVCALVDSVSVPGGGSSSKGARCTS